MNQYDRLPEEFLHDLQTKADYSGEIRFDLTSKILYSTDASIYQIQPLGVAFPRTDEDLIALVKTADCYDLPILARGSGSSLAGQAIGKALIIDCSRYLNRLLEVDREAQTALVEPGLILNKLNRAISPFQLQFGPDPASAERATLGGCIANNAAGAHSIIYGMTADHIISLDVILSDGSTVNFSEIGIDSAHRIAQNERTLESKLYAEALQIRENISTEIKTHWPETWRCASGYNLNYLIPWSNSQPPQWDSNPTWFQSIRNPLPYPPVSPGSINLAPLIAGSEGTIAIIQKAQLRLVKKPKATILGVIGFNNVVEACESVPEILALQPSAIELIPQSLIQLARSVPAYASLTSFVNNLSLNGRDPGAYLVVEFAGENNKEIKDNLMKLSSYQLWTAESPDAQKTIWDVRKVGLGILMSRKGNHKPVAFIEDTAVPVNHLAEYVREIEKILSSYNTNAEFYAHASAGCLHIRPILNLKSAQGVKILRSIAEQVVNLTIRLGGAISAEHSDGLARGEWLEILFGTEIVRAFHKIKDAADPKGLLNPGKIVNPPKMDQNLRFREDYQPNPWTPTVLFQENQIEIVEAIEQCNGAGVCRKSEGVMCPSFQISQEEMHSTRGRSNLLRALISGQFPTKEEGQQAVREALDLCLACKGCKSECPSGVDVAKLKYEFLNFYYGVLKHPRWIRDYLFGYIGDIAKLSHQFAPFVNSILSAQFIKFLGDRFIGLSSQRTFPKMVQQSLDQQWKMRSKKIESTKNFTEKVLFLSDAFTEYFQPHIGLAALDLLTKIGCKIEILPTRGAGRTLISKGFLKAAKNHADHLLKDIQLLDPEGKIPIVGIEPSEIYTLRDEFLDFYANSDQINCIANRTYTIEEFLVRPGIDGELRFKRLSFKEPTTFHKLLYHGHCYQKAQPPAADGFPNGVAASVSLLKSIGYPVLLIDDGCCGMAGAFGYEKEHYEFSMRVAENVLFPTIREMLQANSNCLVCTSGVSCHSQISDGLNLEPYHPVELILKYVK